MIEVFAVVQVMSKRDSCQLCKLNTGMRVHFSREISRAQIAPNV